MANTTVFSNIRPPGEEFEVIKVLSSAQALNTTSDEVLVSHAKNITLYTEGKVTSVSAGVVTLEGSPTSGHTGTWKSLGTVTVPSGKALGAVSITDGDDGFPTRFVRVRISTLIANGNIDAYLVVQR